MHEISIKQSDYGRIVRSELLPYELPYRFSYDVLHSKSSPAKKAIDILINQVTGSARIKPIQFQVSKSPLTSAVRTLTILPPSLVGSWQDFYRNYHQVIISLCNRSNWSLRKPTDVAKIFFFKSTDWEIGTDTVESDHLDERTSAKLAAQLEHHSQAAISTFFVYSRHSALSQFFNSRDIKELEKTFVNCHHIDIANCFNSIYSHSIAWASRGKAEAKKTFAKRGTFDSDFDFLMRSSNYGETAGIPVGPEISRIFAEILLQECDSDIKVKLEAEGLSEHRDYAIRRYIDDYFIFTNHDHNQDQITNSIKKSLFRYNLHLNETKFKRMSRPFVSSISLCKKKISIAVSSLLPPLEEDQPYSQHFAQIRAGKFFDEVRHIASSHSESFRPLIAFILGILKNLASKALKNAQSGFLVDASLNRLIEILCISEELMSVNLNYRTSVLLSEIIFNVSHGLREVKSPHAQTISSFSISIIHRTLVWYSDHPPSCRADFSTLLLTSRDLKESERLDFSSFLKLCHSDVDLSEFSCVDLCVSLYYYSSSEQTEIEKNHLISKAIERITNCESIASDTDATCLGLDLISCPFIPLETKNMLIRLIDPNSGLPQDCWDRIKNTDTFFNWRNTKEPGMLLQKKSLSFVY